MRVFVVIFKTDYEPSDVEEVFAAFENAAAYIESCYERRGIDFEKVVQKVRAKPTFVTESSYRHPGDGFGYSIKPMKVK